MRLAVNLTSRRAQGVTARLVQAVGPCQQSRQGQAAVSIDLGGVSRLGGFRGSRSSRSRRRAFGRSRTTARRSGTSATTARRGSTRTTAAAVATVMTPAVAAAASRSATARGGSTRTTTATMMAKSRRRLFATHEGDSDHREKDRDAKNQRAIHLRILLQGTGTFGSQTKHTPSYVLTPTVTASNWAKPQHVRLSQAVDSLPRRLPCL